MSYEEQIRKIERSDPTLSKELAPLRTLEHVLFWMKCHRIQASKMNVVTQDEFNHDAIVTLPDKSAIVFGVT